MNRNISVVIVEDEAVNMLYLQKALQQYGYTLKASFSSSDEVLNFLEHGDAEIVLMDIGLSGSKDGIDTAKLVNSRFGIPVIFITAHTDEETVNRAIAASPFAYIVKPFTELEIHSAIQIAYLQKQQVLAEKKVNELEEFHLSILNSMDSGIVVADVAGRIMFWNPIAEKIYPELVEVGHHGDFSMILPEPSRDQLMLLVRGCTDDEQHVDIRDMRYHGPVATYIAGKISCLHNQNKLTGIVYNFDDVSDRVELHKQILEIDTALKARVGRDLHDSLGQMLTGISLMVKVAENKMEKVVPENSLMLSEISNHLNNAITVTRGLARGLVPVDLEKTSLFDAFDDLAVLYSESYGIPFLVFGDRSISIIDTQLANNIYFVASEASANALRHGHATRIELSLQAHGEFLVLVIANNGLALENRKTAQGLGMKIMEYRASLHGGSCSLAVNNDGLICLTACFRYRSNHEQF